MFTTIKSRVLGGSALVLVAALALGVSVAADHHDETAATTQESQSRIGTFDPQNVFQQYHGISELIALSQRLEQEAQEAQAAGDQQRLMQLQQEMQAGQQRVINQFQEDLDRVMPEVARENELTIVAVEIVYTDPDMGEPMDITQEVVERLNEDAPEGSEIPPMPGPPGQPGAPGAPGQP